MRTTIPVGNALAEWIEAESMYGETMRAEGNQVQLLVSRARMKVLLHMKQHTNPRASYCDNLATDEAFRARVLDAALCNESVIPLNVLMQELEAGLWETGAPQQCAKKGAV